MGLALILAGLALTFLGIFAWMWLCAGLGHDGWRGVVGKLALQLSAICLVYGFVRGEPWNGLFLATFPPLALSELGKALDFLPFLTEVAWHTAPYSAAALAISLLIQPLRVWSLGLTLAAALIAAVFVGDGISQAAMCRSAAKYGFSAFNRNSFGWSLANTPRDWQFEIHARVNVNGKPMGWSYANLDWYVIPKDIMDDVTGPVFTCPPV